MLELASSLLEHQRGLHRRPAVEVLVIPERFGVPTLRPATYNATTETEYPHASAFAPDGTFVQVANRNGTLERRLDFVSSATIDTAPSPGDPVALAATSTELVAIVGQGTTLARYQSTDNGANWTGPTTIVTEASAISAVALAANPTGNLCAFYVLNSTSTVKRLRRTSGTWAASGTTWTRTADWASISGIAAARGNGLFNVLVTGIAATTTRPTVAAYAMGDGALPSNSWFGPELVLQADAASTLTYADPFVAVIAGYPFATFTATQTADVAYSDRIHITHGSENTGTATWREPTPTGAYGAAIAADTTTGSVFLSTLSATLAAEPENDLDLSAHVISVRWQHEPFGSRARFTFGLTTGSGLEALTPGNGIRLRLGFHSGTAGAAQYGAIAHFAIERVTNSVIAGKALLTVDAIGPWETLDHWRSPQAWTAPASTTRGGIFEYIAGRAGLSIAQSGSPEWAPSDAWTNQEPAFAIAAGEAGGSVLRRLIEPTGDFLRQDAGFTVVSFQPDQTPAYAYGIDHPIAEATVVEEAAPNWFRIQGPDRYVDAFEETEAVVVGPRFRALRQLSATSDALAEEAAEAALRRTRVLTPRARITVPANVGQELYDPITVTAPALGLNAAGYRVIDLQFDYRAGPSGQALMTHTLTLGEV